MLGAGEARATPLYARAPAIPPCDERCFFIIGLEAGEAPETGGRRERESGYCCELTEEERDPGREEERETGPEVEELGSRVAAPPGELRLARALRPEGASPLVVLARERVPPVAMDTVGEVAVGDG